MMNKYITLISSKEYFLSALVLNNSLKKVNSKYPLVVALTNNLNIDLYTTILNNEQIEYIIIDNLEYPPSTFLNNYIGQKKSLLNTAAKIALFSLNWKDKLIFLDSDMLVRTNIDELFDYPNGAILWIPEEHIGMSGLFVFTPYYHNYEFYQCLLKNLPGLLDGSIIGNLFFPAKDNSDYQISHIKYFTEDLYLRDPGAIYHCNGINKPFLMTPSELKNFIIKYPAYQEYCKFYLPLKIKYPDI